MSEAPEPKRLCLTKKDLNELTKEEIVGRWIEQEHYLDLLEAKANDRIKDNSELVSLRESEEKLKQQQAEATRRENVLVMRLTTKEQEMQEYANQIQELKQAQVPGTSQLRSTLVDPAVNLMFERMKKGLDSTKAKLEETQNDLSAWKFTPDSNTGKRLMAKCRLLHQENEELGKMISSGRIAKLEGDLALQRNFSEEMKKSQADLDEFLLELDEDVEGMQSTIYYLQQQLRETKDLVVKLQQENQLLRTSMTVEEMEAEELEATAKINDVSLTPPLPSSKSNNFATRNALSPVSPNPESVLKDNVRRTNYNDDVEMVPIDELDQNDVKTKVPQTEIGDNSMDTTTVSLAVVDDLLENARSPVASSPENLKCTRPVSVEIHENSKSPRPISPENSRSPRSALSEFAENSRSSRPTSPENTRSPRRASSEFLENTRSPRRAASEFLEHTRSPKQRTSREQSFDDDREMDSSPVLEIDMDASPSECETDIEQRTIQTPPPLQFRTIRENEEKDGTKDVRKEVDETTTGGLENEVAETTAVNDRSLTNSLESTKRFEVEKEEDIELGEDELVIDCPQSAVNGNGYSIDDDDDEEVAAAAGSEHSDSESQSVSSTEDNSRQTLTPSPRTPETPPSRESYTPPRETYTPPLPVKDVKMCEKDDDRKDSVHLDGETNCTKFVISRDSADEKLEFSVSATKKPSLNGISDAAIAPASVLDGSVL